jgi:hypothetical protein
MNMSQAPFRTYLLSKQAEHPGLTDKGLLISPINCFGHSSMHTNGRLSFRSWVYNIKDILHPGYKLCIRFRGNTSFPVLPRFKFVFFNVCRMVSRDTCLASVCSRVTQASSNNRKDHRAQPSGAGPHTKDAGPAASLQGRSQTLLHKPQPQFLAPSSMHPNPVGDYLIGIPFVGKQQCLRPFAFLGAVFPLVDNFMKHFLFIFRERYPVFFL